MKKHYLYKYAGSALVYDENGTPDWVKFNRKADTIEMAFQMAVEDELKEKINNSPKVFIAMDGEEDAFNAHLSADFSNGILVETLSHRRVF